MVSIFQAILLLSHLRYDLECYYKIYKSTISIWILSQLSKVIILQQVEKISS